MMYHMLAQGVFPTSFSHSQGALVESVATFCLRKVLKLIVVGIIPTQGQCQAWCWCQWSVVPGMVTLLL